MGKRAPSPPPPPDPVAIANAEKTANIEAARETAKLNAINQYTPFGNVVFDRDGSGIPVSQTTTLSPDQQALVDLQSNIGVQLGQLAQNQANYIANNQFQLPDTLPNVPSSLGVSTPEFPLGVDTSGLAPIPGAQDFSADAQRLEDATFSRSMNLLNPEFDRQRRQTEQTLFDRGLPQTGEAYTRELNRLDQAQNEARLAAAQEAVQSGRAEQSRLFGQGVTARQLGFGEAAQNANMQQQARQQAIAEAAQNAQLAANSRQQLINELMLERSQPFNELSAFLQGAPSLPVPQAQPLQPINIAPPNVLGAHQLNAQVAMNNYNQQMDTNRGITAGLFSLPGQFIGSNGLFGG